MKTLSNDIILRPRFQIEVDLNSTTLLDKFEKSASDLFICKRLDGHLFLKINQKNIHFWSPQLHLEIDETSASSCKVYGVFGPNPSLWTFFMFIHFAIALLFLVFAVWGYSNWTLDKPYFLQSSSMFLLVLVWISLYVFGRMGKQKGKPQMQQLYDFTLKTIYS